MGYCCDVRCHNAPHAMQVGWAGPLKTLDADSWPPGVWLTYRLPAAADSPRNFIRAWPNWSKRGAKSRIYIQFKCARLREDGGWKGGAEVGETAKRT